MSNDAILQTGLTELNLTLPHEASKKLLQFLTLLQKWNRAYNLTAITEIEKMISYHLLDSLSIAPYVTGDAIVDVGSGAGLPGIPLAIYFPNKSFTLIDSIGKKTRFMQHVARELSLTNVTVVQARAEEYQTRAPFDTMVTRAVGSVETMQAIAKRLLKPNGELLMMQAEPAIAQTNERVKVIALAVPGVAAARSLLIFKRT